MLYIVFNILFINHEFSKEVKPQMRIISCKLSNHVKVILTREILDSKSLGISTLVLNPRFSKHHFIDESSLERLNSNHTFSLILSKVLYLCNVRTRDDLAWYSDETTVIVHLLTIYNFSDVAVVLWDILLSNKIVKKFFSFLTLFYSIFNCGI